MRQKKLIICNKKILCAGLLKWLDDNDDRDLLPGATKLLKFYLIRH